MNEPHKQNAPRRRWQTDAQWNALRGRIDEAVLGRNSGQGLQIDPGKPRDWRVYAGAATTGVAAAALLVTMWWPRDAAVNAPLQWKQFATTAGQRDSIRLPDSSMVALGPSTTVRYAMSESRREVELRGVARFEVTHDAARPFSVRARNAVAVDLGTRFVVRSFDSDTLVGVFVSSGVVALGDSSGKTRVTLHAGNAGFVTRRGATTFDGNADTAGSEAWLRGQLIFNNLKLRDAAAQLGDWFGVVVRVPDATLAERRITAVYTEPLLTGVLEALSATLGLSYRQQGLEVTLQPASKK